MHPYELGRTLREHGDARSVKYTPQLALHGRRPARAGRAHRRPGARAGRAGGRSGRSTRSRTPGARSWATGCASSSAEPRHEYPHFVTALSLIGALGPDEAVELLARRLERLAAVRAETRASIDETVAGGVHPLFLVEEEYRLALLDAERAFVEGFIARITDPETGWRAPWAAIHEGGDPG